MSALTPRQEEAFGRYKEAIENYWEAKTRPVVNNEQAKARWAEVNRLRDLRENAEDELFASIVDEMPDPLAPDLADAKTVETFCDLEAAGVFAGDDACTCAVDATSLCPIHHGYAR